jgi:hypothetical protein
MLRISLPYVYEFSWQIQQLRTLQMDQTLSSCRYTLFTAQSSLETFLYGSVYSGAIRAAQSTGAKLIEAIKKLTASDTAQDNDRTLDWVDVWSITHALDQFENVLVAEMNTRDAFFVTKKRAYDTTDLIDRAEILLPIEFAIKAQEAIDDVRQAGKCLAFELPTAAGFHMMRALEHVLRLYYDVASGGAPRPENNNMGVYLNELSNNNWGSEKVRACLRQIKDLHRNELIHPDITLSLDDALGLWGIVQSAIGAMLPDLPIQKLELQP